MGPEVHEQMFRSGSQFDAKPTVLSSQASLVFIYRPTGGMKRSGYVDFMQSNHKENKQFFKSDENLLSRIQSFKYRIQQQYSQSATETSRNKIARVIERDISGKMHYFLKIPEGFELAKMVTKVAKLAANLVTKNDANLALSPRFRQVLIESPL
ncbi:hypothetical protein TNCV_3130411 [Trichonephila clavipes]|nr:hypothetical protein TNCV_3130411 [Trichonephila clavipes]